MKFNPIIWFKEFFTPKPRYLYAIISFMLEGRVHCCAGFFTSKEDAIKGVLTSGPHDIWEWAYSYVCIEKQRLNDGVGHPCLVSEREPIEWFRWVCEEPFETTQTGQYVPCECPEWAKGVLGYV